MVERRELITICRQIGTMMEVGVDFLRITRALRDQTDNPRLLELYEQLDHDMRMGENLADAISKAPDVFSPFAVSLVRQGEARGDIEGAWHRLADFLKQEAQEDKDLGVEATTFGVGYIPTRGMPSNGLEVVAPRAPVTVGMLSDLIDRIQSASLRGLTWIAAFLLALAAVWWSVELDWIGSRWMVGIQLCVAAVFLGVAGSWLRLRMEKNRARQPICSFCGKAESDEITLQRSSRLAGAAICQSCARAVAGPIEPVSVEDTPSPTSSHNRRLSDGFQPAPTHEISEDDGEDPFRL
ncbi:MAG TPA: type II secretion system F family protein [Abditibacterium sp.]|jgi:hypothetical protein